MNEQEFQPWVEKYRPKKLSEVIGHEEIVKRLEAFAKTKNMPHLLLAGRAGIGKTSCILSLAHELYGDDIRQSFLEMNSSDERGIDIVRGRIKDFARTIPLSSVPYKLILLDEADSLTPDAQQALRRTMETFSKTCRFALNCNFSSRIIEPIQSRCAVFRFIPLNDDYIKKILKHIAEKEKLHLDEKAIEAICYVSEGDARKAINCLQGAASVSGGKITEEEVFKVSSRAKPVEVSKMIHCALEGKFVEARKLLDELMLKYAMSGEEVLLQMYREIISLDIPDRQKVELVDKLGEYEFRMSQGSNERIQLEALLAGIMLYGSKK